METSSRRTRDKGMLTIFAILSVKCMQINAFHHPYSSWFFVSTTSPSRVAPLRQRSPQLCLSSSPGNEVIGTKKKTLYSIESLLDDGDIDGALLELKRLEGGEEGPSNVGEVAAAAYHTVIEACCAGGHVQDQGRKKGENGINTRKVDLIDVAEDLLQSMNNATAHAYETVISGYARRGKWSDALQKLVLMEEEFRPIGRNKSKSDEQSVPSLNVYQAVLVACARAGQYDNVTSLLTKMRRRGVRPNVYTYNSLLNVCAKDKETRWKEALSLLSQCQREPGIDPDLVTYTTAMRACIRGRRSDKAIEIFRVVKDMGIELDVYCYTTAMDACAKGKMWKTALSILREMKEKGIEPNEVTYGVAVAACGNGGRWEKALELLDQMREMNMKINTITYNAAVSALAKAARTESKQQRRFDFKQKGGKYHATGNQPQNSEVNLLWCKTLDLLDCMESEGVLRDSFTFSSAISTCGAAGRWEEAMHLINTMKADGDRGIKPNRFAYTSAITACGNSGEWEPALKLFNDMKLDGLQPDLVSYNALIGAGMTANQPEQVSATLPQKSRFMIGLVILRDLSCPFTTVTLRYLDFGMKCFNLTRRK
mmetsp:Transcript_9130/g.18876  ORF Transcript_9130/g.18876 Transcript_9130/m.18876 type:complete len:596 (-) Transcript_9130:525-2312(-)